MLGKTSRRSPGYGGPPDTSTIPPPEDKDMSITRRKTRSRAALLDAAVKLMPAGAPAAISVDDLVAEAQLAKGTFYNHFSDRSELHDAVVLVARTEARRQIFEETADIADPARRLARAFCIALRFRLENPEKAHFIGVSLGQFTRPMDFENEGIIAFLGHGLAQGRFKLPSIEAGLLLVFGLIKIAYARATEKEDRFSHLARSQQLTTLMLRGIGIVFEEAEMIGAQETEHIIGRWFAEHGPLG
jgi:AcrR family transcriptional regulator